MYFYLILDFNQFQSKLIEQLEILECIKEQKERKTPQKYVNYPNTNNRTRPFNSKKLIEAKQRATHTI